MKNTLGKNIKRIRLENKITQEELGNFIGVNKATIQRYENGKITNIPSDKIEKMAKFLKISPSELMGWEENKTNHICVSDKLSDYSTSNLTNIKDLNIVPIPHITNFVASCGNGIDFECLEDTTETIYLPTELVGENTKNSWVMHTIGDSMNKRIPENSNIIVKQNDYYNNGDIVLYKITDNFAIKEYYLYADRIVLKPASYNPLHEQETYNFEDRDNGFEFPEIIGKVISFYGSV